MNRTKFHSSIGEKLYLSEDFADFHFLIKSKSDDSQSERIPVHKNILATGSDVFRVMFNGTWKEKFDVEIVDATADAFKEFLQFFYLSKVKLTIGNVAEVMNLGKKYDIAECFNICGRFLGEHLSDDDICTVYGLAIHLEHKDLEILCAKYIANNSKTIFKSENPFKHCERKTVKQILQVESLSCSEAEVFESLMKWIKAKVEPEELTKEIVQCEFNDLIHEIRFGSMTLDEFVSFDPLYGHLFTCAQHREIVQMFHSNQFQPKIFKANCRNNLGSFEWNKDAAINCYRYTEVLPNTPYYIKNIETTTFTVNKPMVLGSFHIYRIYDYVGYPYPSTQPQSEITIFEILGTSDTIRKMVLFKQRKSFEVGTETTINLLPKPILIRPETKYEIQIKMENLPSTKSWCTKFYILKTEVHIEPDITLNFHNDPTINDEARGLIYGLGLNKI